MAPKLDRVQDRECPGQDRVGWTTSKYLLRCPEQTQNGDTAGSDPLSQHNAPEFHLQDRRSSLAGIGRSVLQAVAPGFRLFAEGM